MDDERCLVFRVWGLGNPFDSAASAGADLLQKVLRYMQAPFTPAPLPKAEYTENQARPQRLRVAGDSQVSSIFEEV